MKHPLSLHSINLLVRTNEKILIKEIRTIIDTRAGMGGFDKLFRDCGYLNPGENEEESEDDESEEEE